MGVDKAFPLVSEPVYGEVNEQQGGEMSADGNLVLDCSLEKNSYEERGEGRWKGRRFCPCLMDSTLSK